ncbi:helix-turn-helix transcriptional regulator [Streptomyces dioscori]|uniref:Helix-turn-helix transcriptional regulator n=2 Tax=Streptomyces dioscori TaxID=2109333 RepID=A0A2P8QAK4_9ACTN|nr:helix-turn-helix transcriptional regulator [Streptomyces dioscori]PSM43266.1 helix-turn-helix transcriptional regulator [Streptomyces dioscori]
MRGALMRLRRETGLAVAFGGLVEPGRAQVRISELNGTTTAALSALAVSSGNGLGGKAVALVRPCAVTDYSSSRRISHEYDVAVAAEGLRSVLAVPVVVRRRVRGVLYGALRSAQPLGDRTLSAAVAAARDVEQSLAVRDEAYGLLAAAREPGAHEGPERHAGAEGAVRERLREAHGALRALAPRVMDPVLRAELLSVCETLVGSPGPARTAGPAGSSGALGAVGAVQPAGSVQPTGSLRSAGSVHPAGQIRLTPRELDVLSCVAVGRTNAGAGERLGLRAETVKAYLRSAMRKLGAHTRLEAVVAARRAGLLP